MRTMTLSSTFTVAGRGTPATVVTMFLLESNTWPCEAPPRNSTRWYRASRPISDQRHFAPATVNVDDNIIVRMRVQRDF